jgi:colanic acid/amylovoran biosynthesis glycosyltransferase
MKNILHIERVFSSPSETFIFNQINETKNFNKYVLTIEYKNVFQNNFQVIKPDFKLFNNKKILFPHIRNHLLNKLFSLDIDIIHTHYLTDASFFYPMTKYFKCPKICSVYGYDVSEFPNRFMGLGKKYLKRVFLNYDLILAMSDDMKNDLLNIGCPEEKIKIHYFGTDVTKFKNTNRNYDLKSNKINILTVANLIPKKGYEYVIRALNEIKNSIPFHYHIVGDGVLRERLEQLVMSYGLDDCITFYGHINYSESNVLYNNADLFILPSVCSDSGDKEGIPGVIVEAMANGLPVISTYHAGIPSIITNGDTGLLHKEKDYLSIAKSIIDLYSNQNLRRDLGTRALNYSKINLDYIVNTRILEKIYQSLIK